MYNYQYKVWHILSDQKWHFSISVLWSHYIIWEAFSFWLSVVCSHKVRAWCLLEALQKVCHLINNALHSTWGLSFLFGNFQECCLGKQKWMLGYMIYITWISAQLWFAIWLICHPFSADQIHVCKISPRQGRHD